MKESNKLRRDQYLDLEGMRYEVPRIIQNIVPRSERTCVNLLVINSFH
jgi:hypothetical protein